MTFGDVDQINERALASLDRLIESGPHDEPDDHERRPLPLPQISDWEARQIAEQHDLQVGWKW